MNPPKNDQYSFNILGPPENLCDADSSSSSASNLYPAYLHPIPSGMYAVSIMPVNDVSKRRKRTNYRDPENASKLGTALGVLLKQKEENAVPDIKSVAIHFGLPYNTLRDNFLK